MKKKRRPYRFRIIHLLFLMTLMATATFSATSLLIGSIACVFWGVVFISSSRPKAFVLSSLVVVFVLSPLFFLFEVNRPSDSIRSIILPHLRYARRASCEFNLRTIGLALQSYHDQYDTFPPAYIADESGKPIHSWRVLILPFLEYSSLYDQYDFSEPWDGPNNSKLLDSLPEPYGCPAQDHGNATSYLAIVGPRTAWLGDQGRKESEFKNELSQTVLVLEASSEKIPWMEPRDFDFESALKSVQATKRGRPAVHHEERYQEWFFKIDAGRNVMFADGTVRGVSDSLDQETWKAIFTLDKRASWSNEKKLKRLYRERPIYWNWFRLTLFIVALSFPLPWVWICDNSLS